MASKGDDVESSGQESVVLAAFGNRQNDQFARSHGNVAADLFIVRGSIFDTDVKQRKRLPLLERLMGRTSLVVLLLAVLAAALIYLSRRPKPRPPDA